MSLASTILVASIPVLLSIYTGRLRKADEAAAFVDNPANLNLPIRQTYDFIIIGGGTAGCILANRLSNDFSVLVLELGGDPPPLTSIRLIADVVDDSPALLYDYKSAPELNAALENGGLIETISGKMLGGSGHHNGMQWERGSPYDYDRWAEVTRDDSWKYQNVLHYFKKIENYNGKYADSRDHGRMGPMNVVDGTPFYGQQMWFDAGQEMGFQVMDSNGHQTEGFSQIQYSALNGHRASTYTAYLQPILKTRKKLTVSRYSAVSEILFEDKTAVGVRYKRHGVDRIALASKEIILSAGTYISPIILFKSGIGPKDQVEAAKAPKHVISLPVGKNLQDHPEVYFNMDVNDPQLNWNMQRNLTFEDIELFARTGEGPMGAMAEKAEAFIMSSRAKEEEKDLTQGHGERKWPDIQIGFHNTGTKEKTVNLLVSNSRPLSRGVLTINASATSMEDDRLPIMTYNHFSEESDYDVTIEGINFVLTMEDTKAFQKVGAQLNSEPLDACKSHRFRSNAYWKCYIRQKATTGWHSVGTCRMGYGEDDKDAVVDSKFNVIGVKRLRVVDASVFPYIVNANICTPTMMLAEKGAAEILNTYRSKRKRRGNKSRQ